MLLLMLLPMLLLILLLSRLQSHDLQGNISCRYSSV